jgi:hypothetical protein
LNDGSHGRIFAALDGKLMTVLHSPNGHEADPRIFEVEDIGETLKIVQELADTTPRMALL